MLGHRVKVVQIRPYTMVYTEQQIVDGIMGPQAAITQKEVRWDLRAT